MNIRRTLSTSLAMSIFGAVIGAVIGTEAIALPRVAQSNPSIDLKQYQQQAANSAAPMIDGNGNRISEIYAGERVYVYCQDINSTLDDITYVWIQDSVGQYGYVPLAAVSPGCGEYGNGSITSTPPSSDQRTAYVQFQPGSDTATLSGTIVGQEYFDYVLRAREGQLMSVLLTIDGTNGNGSAFFNILPPGSTGEAIFNGSTSPDRYGQVRLPRDGDYTIRVYLMGNDRDTDRTVGYTVSVTIR